MAVMAMTATLHGHRVGRTVQPPQSPRSRRWWMARTRPGPPAWAATKRTAASTASTDRASSSTLAVERAEAMYGRYEPTSRPATKLQKIAG